MLKKLPAGKFSGHDAGLQQESRLLIQQTA
jgi:hypothetical protein